MEKSGKKVVTFLTCEKIKRITFYKCTVVTSLIFLAHTPSILRSKIYAKAYIRFYTDQNRLINTFCRHQIDSV